MHTASPGQTTGQMFVLLKLFCSILQQLSHFQEIENKHTCSFAGKRWAIRAKLRTLATAKKISATCCMSDIISLSVPRSKNDSSEH